jgi:hypothetical protein
MEAAFAAKPRCLLSLRTRSTQSRSLADAVGIQSVIDTAQWLIQERTPR